MIYASTKENVQDIIGTIGGPYKYWSAYSVTVPGLEATDRVLLTARAEVTNTFGIPIMIASFFSTQAVYGGPQPPVVGPPPAGDDLALGQLEGGQCHKTIVLSDVLSGFDGDTTFSLILYCASSNFTIGKNNWLVLNQGYGKITATVL